MYYSERKSTSRTASHIQSPLCRSYVGSHNCHILPRVRAKMMLSAAYEVPSDLPWTSWEDILRKWPELLTYKPEDCIDSLIEEILHTPVTMMSEKVSGLDDRPLGISMAMKYQRKGELSLWHDCLLRLVPGPLKWDFWSNMHAAASESPEEYLNNVQPCGIQQPQQIHVDTNIRVRQGDTSSIYSCDEDGEPVSSCRTIWDRNPFTVTIFDNGFKDFVVDSKSPCDSAFITALPPVFEYFSQCDPLNVSSDVVTGEEDNDLFRTSHSSSDENLTRRCRRPTALVDVRHVNDFDGAPDFNEDVTQASVDRGQPLSRSLNECRYDRAGKAKTTRARLANIKTDHLCVTADGSPINFGGAASTAPIMTVKTEAEPFPAVSTPATYVTCRTSKAELFSTPPPSFPIQENQESPSSRIDDDPFIQSTDAVSRSGHCMANAIKSPSLAFLTIEKCDESDTKAKAYYPNNATSGSSKRVSTPGAHPALPLSKYNQLKTSSPNFVGDDLTPAKSTYATHRTPWTNDQAGLATNTNNKTPNFESHLTKQLPALPLASAAASAAMNQADIHPAQRVYPGFLTSLAEGITVGEPTVKRARADHPPIVRVERVEDTEKVHDKAGQNTLHLNNSWAASRRQLGRQRYPPRSSSLDANQHLDVQACPGTPGSVGSSSDRYTGEFLSLNSILLEGPPRVSQVVREQVREEFHRGHNTFVASQTHRHGLRNLLPTAFSIPLAPKASISVSWHRSPSSCPSDPPESASSAPAAVMQISSVTNQPVPGVLVPPHRQHVSLRARRRQQGMPFPKNTTAGAVASAATAAFRRRASLATMLIPSSSAPSSPKTEEFQDRERLGKKGK